MNVLLADLDAQLTQLTAWLASLGIDCDANDEPDFS